MPKKRKIVEWSLDDDLSAQYNRDWNLTRPKKRKPVKSKAKPKRTSSASASLKNTRLAEAQARSVAIASDQSEKTRRAQIASSRERKRMAGRRAGLQLAISKKLISKGKEIGRIKGRKNNPVGRTAARFNAQALETIGHHVSGSQAHFGDILMPQGTNRQRTRVNALASMEQRDLNRSISRGFRKVRGAKPTSAERIAGRKSMAAGRGKPLGGVLPVVATLAAGWLSGELKKKKGKA